MAASAKSLFWTLQDTSLLFSLGSYLWRSVSRACLAPPRKPGYMLVFFLSWPTLRMKKPTLLVFQKCQFKIHISVSTLDWRSVTCYSFHYTYEHHVPSILSHFFVVCSALVSTVSSCICPSALFRLPVAVCSLQSGPSMFLEPWLSIYFRVQVMHILDGHHHLNPPWKWKPGSGKFGRYRGGGG